MTSTNKIEQSDMPVARGNGGKFGAFNFTTLLCRIRSTDGQRTELYHRPKLVGRLRGTTMEYHFSSAERRGHVVTATAAGIAILVATGCIEAIPDPEDDREDEDEMLDLGFRTEEVRIPVGGASMRVTDDGKSLACVHGALPGVIHANEVAVPHLEDIVVAIDAAGRDVTMLIDASAHLWTSKPDRHFYNGPVILDGYRRLRHFSPKRFRLSKGVRAMFATMRSNHVYRTDRFEHFGMYRANGNQENAYTVFFTFEHRRPGDPANTLRVKVTSGYVARKPDDRLGIDIARTLENLLDDE